MLFLIFTMNVYTLSTRATILLKKQRNHWYKCHLFCPEIYDFEMIRKSLRFHAKDEVLLYFEM